MKLTLNWSVAVFVAVCVQAVLWLPAESTPTEETLSMAAIPSNMSENATCDDWVSWVPPHTDPAVVMQVVSEDYADLERNFIGLMELNSAFTRQHLYLMCLDEASVPVFASLGIRCLPIGQLHVNSHQSIWETRVRVVSCLVTEGYNVVMSDSDALWLGDPMEYVGLPAVTSSSVVASRGIFPEEYGRTWGSTMCMGFIMFRATGAATKVFQDAMERIVLESDDDQIAVNRAAFQLGVAWDKGSDMRYETSTGFGKGTIAELSSDDGEPFEISLLPHNRFTRICASTPVTNETIVAHCLEPQQAGAKLGWMQDLDLWSPDGVSP